MRLKNMLFVVTSLLITVLAAGTAFAANPDKCEPAEDFLILKDQQYALCANATCLTFNQVAYCGCDLLKGDSISLPFDFGDGEDVCTVNQDGRGNGYRVSTYSVPKRSVFPEGDYALYTCPGELNKDKYGGVAAASGSYAQCDGGLCFMSTKGRNFPGFENMLVSYNDQLRGVGRQPGRAPAWRSVRQRRRLRSERMSQMRRGQFDGCTVRNVEPHQLYRCTGECSGRVRCRDRRHPVLSSPRRRRATTQQLLLLLRRG